MADKKISALTGASTPVAGSEVLPIVQSGATVKVSIDNLTSGKTVPTNGVQFPATQVASADANCLDDYEEGTWTPSISAFAGSITTVGAVAGVYTKIGRQVTLSASFDITLNGTGSVLLQSTGIPFSGSGTTVSRYTGSGYCSTTGKSLNIAYTTGGANTIYIAYYDNSYPGANASSYFFTLTYIV